ncbi:MAG TPA: hypothetical protein VGO70_02030 [Arsenicitalea sp.]|nr:hypothetical protein [Arsenicitalea sp.]
MWKSIATFVFAGLCLAAAPAMAQNAASSKQIDISKAGATPQEHQAFVKAMSPQQQAAVIEACVPVIVKPAADTPPAVAAFCKTVGTTGVPAAGTTAADNASFVKGLPADEQANLKAVCVPVVAQPADASGPTMLITFCKNVTGS